MDPASQPPPYNPGGAPPPQGYPPPQPGYPPQPQPGYPPQPQPGYQPQPGAYPPPQPGAQPTNVVVVGQPAPQQTIIVKEKKRVHHLLHCIISIFFWPWIIVWIILCITRG